MNCAICRRAMINMYAQVYECRYCGYVNVFKANHVTTQEPRPNSPPNRKLPGSF